MLFFRGVDEGYRWGGAYLFVSVCEGLFASVTGATVLCPGGAPVPRGLVWLNVPGGISADRCT